MIPAGQPWAVGVAGWSYPDWVGYVYDRSVRDGLAFLADYVDMIEINSTFYRPAQPRQAESWLSRVQRHPDFFFTAKLSREITHEGERDLSIARQFMEGLRPLRDAGRLRAVLAQFRYDFDDSSHTREHHRWIAENVVSGVPLVLELRHRSWQTEEALAFLESLGVSVAHLDYPKSRQSFELDVVPFGVVGYFRLHGRNADAWFDAKAGRAFAARVALVVPAVERLGENYFYSGEERRELVHRAKRIAQRFRSLTIVANNHYQGKEVANALQIKAALQGAPVAVPPLLLRRYPELHDVADELSLKRAQDGREPDLFG